MAGSARGAWCRHRANSLPVSSERSRTARRSGIPQRVRAAGGQQAADRVESRTDRLAVCPRPTPYAARPDQRRRDRGCRTDRCAKRYPLRIRLEPGTLPGADTRGDPRGGACPQLRPGSWVAAALLARGCAGLRESRGGGDRRIHDTRARGAPARVQPGCRRSGARTDVRLGIAFLGARRTATPAVAICMLLAGMVAFDGFCAFHAGHPAMTLAIGLALLFAGGRDPYKMRIRALRDRYAKPAPYPPPAHGAARELVDLRRTIEQSGNSRPLVLVCASGGGIRAAVWAAWILERLDHLDGFRPAAPLVTGASGGMVGAMVRVASLCAGKNAFRTDGVTGDGLTAVARRLAFGDVPLAFLPLANEDNRGQALEDAWRVHGGPALDMTFAELRGGEQDGRWPSLVFSPILVEDGRRLLISNVDLSAAAQNLVHWIEQPRALDLASTSAYHLADVVPGGLDRLPVRTAARLSSSFPYVSPAAVLPTRPRRP